SSPDDVVQVFISVVRVILLTVTHPGTDPVVSRGSQAVLVPVFEFVPGQLLKDEPGVGFVLIEGPDDVVPVPPGVGDVIVMLIAGAVRVAHHIEPEPAPSLPVMRGGEQALDQILIGAGRWIAREGVYFFRAGQQSD